MFYIWRFTFLINIMCKRRIKKKSGAKKLWNNSVILRDGHGPDLVGPGLKCRSEMAARRSSTAAEDKQLFLQQSCAWDTVQGQSWLKGRFPASDFFVCTGETTVVRPLSYWPATLALLIHQVSWKVDTLPALSSMTSNYPREFMFFFLGKTEWLHPQTRRLWVPG